MLLLLVACTPKDAAQDQPPSAPVVAFEPAAPDGLVDLVATLATPSVDPDGDDVTYAYAWNVDGLDRIDLVGDTVPASDTDKGETWTVTVVPTAGGLEGDAGTASVTIGDAAPSSAPTVEIEPADPRDDEDFACVVTVDADDPDDDTLTYRYAWTVDGVDANIDDATVPASATAPGETWVCSATPGDGELEGDAGDAIAEVHGCPALSFDGYDDYAVTEVSELTWDDTFTVELWMWWDTDRYYESYDYVLSHGYTDGARAFTLQVDHAEAIDWTTDPGTYAEWLSMPLSADGWHHVAMTLDDGTATFWVDGESVEQDDGFTSPGGAATAEPIYIGGLSTWPDDYSFGGWLGAIRFSRTARYAASFTPAFGWETDPDTLVLWNVDEGSGTTLTDAAPGARNATISGATWDETACP